MRMCLHTRACKRAAQHILLLFDRSMAVLALSFLCFRLLLSIDKDPTWTHLFLSRALQSGSFVTEIEQLRRKVQPSHDTVWWAGNRTHADYSTDKQRQAM